MRARAFESCALLYSVRTLASSHPGTAPDALGERVWCLKLEKLAPLATTYQVNNMHYACKVEFAMDRGAAAVSARTRVRLEAVSLAGFSARVRARL